MKRAPAIASLVGLLAGMACGGPDVPTTTPQGVPVLDDHAATAAQIWQRHQGLAALELELHGITAVDGGSQSIGDVEAEPFMAALGRGLGTAVSSGDIFYVAGVLALPARYQLPEPLAARLAEERCNAGAQLAQAQLDNEGEILSAPVAQWCEGQDGLLREYRELINARRRALPGGWASVVGVLEAYCRNLEETLDRCAAMEVSGDEPTAEQRALCGHYVEEMANTADMGVAIGTEVVQVQPAFLDLVDEGRYRLRASCGDGR